VRMTRIFALVVGVAVLAPLAAYAAVSGSPHDMTAYTGTGTGVAQRLCQACHTPHNAGTDVLWANPVTIVGGFSAVQNLCYTCHDGTITSVGSTTAFSTTLETHTTTGSDCSGGAQSCHDVHNHGDGMFLTVALDVTSGTFCVSCHGATGGGLPGGDHLAGSMHYTSGTTFNCNSCHTPHGAVIQHDGAGDYAFGDVANNKPILRYDNYAGGEYGTMCIQCHNNGAPFTGLVADVHDYRGTVSDGTESTHPTYTTAPTGNWTTPMSGCNVCHDVHNTGGTVTGNGVGSFLLAVENTNSASCVGCHDGVTAPGVTGGGGGSHFTGDVAATSFPVAGNGPNLPWGNQLDEDGNTGQDFTGNLANYMMCETCRSVHKNGFSGTGQGYFLRLANSAQNEICATCHCAN